MQSHITRAAYQAPKLEVQRLRDLPSALAKSGCAPSDSKGKPASCSHSSK
ncbi:MAG: hypothetical protein H0U76_28605 [Ktedonobacteraceae bacterium]|nr:hypothetical protein [Ktedonobacteraceae bacterium]